MFQQILAKNLVLEKLCMYYEAFARGVQWKCIHSPGLLLAFIIPIRKSYWPTTALTTMGYPLSSLGKA